MEQEDYNPTKDPDVTDNLSEEMAKWKRKLMPWHSQIMITLSIVLILLVIFLGIAYGGMLVCSDLDGVLDSKFKCHPGFYNRTTAIDYMGPSLIVPNLTGIENGYR